MQNAENVYVPKPVVGGAAWSGPLTAAVPTDASSDLPSELNGLGYLSADGFTEKIDGQTQSHVAFGGDEVIVVNTSHSVQYVLHPIETNQHTLAERYGEDNVEIGDDGNIAVAVNSKSRPARRYVFEVLLDETHVERTVVPRGKVTAVGERKYGNSDPLGSDITITALPDENGNKAYKYYAEIEVSE